MKTTKTLWLAAVIAAIGAGTALAADSGYRSTAAKGDVQQQIDLHEKMAGVHKQFADCLRSGKSETDCRDQAMKDCPKMGSKNCAFSHEMGWRGGAGWHHGKSGAMGGQGMQNESNTPGYQGTEQQGTPLPEQQGTQSPDQGTQNPEVNQYQK